jgi:hypothetical protein
MSAKANTSKPNQIDTIKAEIMVHVGRI